MADSLYNIFGDHLIKQAVRNASRQPLNNENMGKPMTGPLKPNEPLKKGEIKKSFLSNTGKALQSTPIRQAFTPRAVNVGTLIYNDANVGVDEKGINIEEFEFTKPSYKYDNFHKDVYDYLPLNMPDIAPEFSPPRTPSPEITHNMSLEFDHSYNDDFFIDDFSNDCIQEDLGLPEIY